MLYVLSRLICILYVFAVRARFNQRFACPSASQYLAFHSCPPLKCFRRDSQSCWETCFFSVPLQQLRANIREMEKLCARVRCEDADALEALVKPVRDRASAAARDFLLLHSNPVPQPAPAPPPAAQPSSCVSSSFHADDDVDEEPVYGRQIQFYLPEIPADQSAAESWDNLEEVCMLGLYHFLHVLNSILTYSLDIILYFIFSICLFL